MAGTNTKMHLGRKASQNTAQAQMFGKAWTMIIVGFVLAQGLTLDGIVWLDFLLDSMRDGMNRIEPWQVALSVIGAIVTLMVIAVVIHEAFKRLSEQFIDKTYLWLGLVALLVVLAAPLIMVLQDSNVGGNTLNLNNEEEKAGEALLLWSNAVRVAVFPLAAVVGTMGLHMMISGWNLRQSSRDADRDASIQLIAMKDINRGSQLAKNLMPSLLDLERRMKVDWVQYTHLAAMDQCAEYERYMAGQPSKMNRAIFLDGIDQFVDGQDAIKSPWLAKMVKVHTPEVINLSALPTDGRRLPDAAKLEMQKYVAWIRKNYSKQALMEAIK